MKKLLLFLLCAAFLAPSLAYGGVGLGLKGGIQKDTESDENSESMTMVGADLRITGFQMVEFIVGGDYSWKKYSFEAPAEDMKYSILAITGSAVVPLKMPVITPYAGGGYGSYNIKVEQGDNSDSVTKTGFHIVGGVRVGTPGSPFKLFGEYRHHWVNLGDDATGKYYTITGGIIFGAF